jgi:hypothetical protein
MIEIISTALSLLAIGISIFVFVDARTRYKRDVFLKIHEMMIGESSYRGRQLLLSRDYDADNIDDLDLDQRAPSAALWRSTTRSASTWIAATWSRKTS